MKKNIIIISIVLLSFTAICQSKNIKVEQIFVTNTMTGKSVKLFQSEETLKNFGKLIKVEVMDQAVHSEDYAKKYIFENVVFYVSTKGKISSFETYSPTILIEKKGIFSISPGSSLTEVVTLFAEEVDNAVLTNDPTTTNQYRCVRIKLADFNKNTGNYVDIDYSLNLLYDPQTNILKKMNIWIRP